MSSRGLGLALLPRSSCLILILILDDGRGLDANTVKKRVEMVIQGLPDDRQNKWNDRDGSTMPVIPGPSGFGLKQR